MAKSRQGQDGSLVGCVVVLGAVALLVAGFFLVAPYWSTQLWWVFRQTWFWLIPLLALLGAGFGARELTDGGRPGGGPLTLLVIVGAVAWLSWLFVYNYAQDTVYAQSVRVTQDAVPTFDPRAPYSVSAAQVRSNLGDIPGDTQATMYVPDDETFATLVEQRGFATGYQTLLEQRIGTTGRNTPARCDFGPAAGARLGGVFGGNLGRVINTEQRWVNWDQDDAFGWCDQQGTPFVVVPLLEQEGWLIVTEKPAGVALYDGRTGAIDIRPTADGIPGPTYPLSLAAAQRESTKAGDGFFAWLFGRAGWELPDEADSINSGNASEFVLAGPNGSEWYVTPESGRGSATAISAITVMDAELRGPELAPLVVHRLGSAEHPVWQSATAITDRVRANFGDVFAQQRDSDVYELAPTGPDTWVATIGTPQNMLYRVTGRGDLSADPCLLALDGRQLRCGPTGSVGLATGGPAGSPAPGGQVAPAPAGSDLTTLTPDQLADLNRRVGEELARRANEGGS